jgi:hypothetical protein
MFFGLERSCPSFSTVLLFAVIAIGIPSTPARGQPCASDCDGNGSVDVSELVLAINVALGLANQGDCPAADVNGDGSLTIEELVEAVQRSMSGCDFRAGKEAVESATRVEQTARNTLPVFVFGFGDISAGGGSSFRVAHAQREGTNEFPALEGGGAGQPVPLPCSGDGTILRTCARATNTLATTYDECRFANSEVVRNGTERRTVVVATDPGFDYCANPDLSPPDDATVTVGLEEYSEISPSGGIRLANLSQTFQPAPVKPCVSDEQLFRSGTFSATGFLHVFCDPSLDPTCDETLAELRLTAEDLKLQQVYEEPACDPITQANGRLVVDNVSTGEQTTQTFLGLTFTESIVGDRRIMSQTGRVLVNCLGEIEYSTIEDLSIESGKFCASSGGFRIVIRDPSESGAQSASIPLDAVEQQAALGSEPNSTAVSGGLFDLAYRAANGQVYQVLQNPDGNPELLSEDVRITTAVGSTSGISECSTIETSEPQAQAVVTAVSGFALPTSKVFVSPVFGSSVPPCFNPNGRLGDGLLCLGEGCNSADCRCLKRGFCQELSLADLGSTSPGSVLTPLAQSAVQGSLVGSLGPLDRPCSGAQGRSTYRFGTGGPTVDLDLCANQPQDGFSLRPNSSIVFAYDAPPTSEFFTGAAGFPIDEFGDSDRCPGQAGSVITGVATKNELGRARVSFRNGGVNIDVNDDNRVERSLTSCQLLAVASCVAPPPTPSPPPNRPCPEFRSGVQPEGSTASTAFNVLAGASCGDGGNSSPERTYLFQAPADGCFQIDTRGSSFDTLLYVRRGETCEGPEVACNDNADTSTLDSEVFVEFQRDDPEIGDTAVIVVDGNSGAKGSFRLNVEQVPIGNCDEGGPIRGPASATGVGGTCTVTGNPCATGGATVSCNGLNPGSYRDLYYGVRNDQFVLGETMAGVSGPQPSSAAVFRHSNAQGTLITYLGNSNPVATTIFDANGYPPSPIGNRNVATRLLLTLTSGNATLVATAGGVPADNDNGDVGSLFRVTSSSFSVRVDVQASTPPSPTFTNSCSGLFNPTNTRSAGSLFGAVDREISTVDLGFYWRDLPADIRVEGIGIGAASLPASQAFAQRGDATGVASGAAGAVKRTAETTPTPRPSATHTPTETPTPSPPPL